MASLFSSGAAPVSTTSSAINVVEPTRRQSLAIDIGEDQQVAARALMEARLARRQLNPGDSSFLSRATSLFGSSSSSSAPDLCAIVDKSTNLSKLQRSGIVAGDLVQTPGMSYKRLRNAYTLPSLVNFGFKWQHLLQLGFDVDDLQSVTSDEFRLLGVTATHLLRDLPLTADDMVNMKLQPHVLRELKFNFDHFLKLDLKKDQLCGTGGMMTVEDMHTYFAPTTAQLSSMRSTPQSAPTSSVSPHPSQKNSRQTRVREGTLSF